MIGSGPESFPGRDAVKKNRSIPASKKSSAGLFLEFPRAVGGGKINVEQAEGRNAFRGALIELDGLQSQSVSTRPGS